MLNCLRVPLAGVGSALLIWAAGAQEAPVAPGKTNNPHADAVELLRRVIAEQQKNPNKIIRTPTNPVSGKVSNPSVASKGPRLTRPELERQFLEGKLTAKQYQKAVEDLEKNPPPAAPPVAEKASPREAAATALSPKATSNIPSKVITNQASAAPVPVPEQEPEQKALADVEAKIDEILARREALQQAARTNSASTNAVPAGQMTKRQKLDALLRQLIQSKITEEEYKAEREKVLALPD